MASLDEFDHSRRRSAAITSRPIRSLLARIARCGVASSESTDRTLKAAFFGASFQKSTRPYQKELLDESSLDGIEVTVKEKRKGPNRTELLGDDALSRIFEFLGKGHFRSVAGTCSRFRRIYKPFDVYTIAEEFVLTTAGARLFYTEAVGKSLNFKIAQDGSRLSSWPNDYFTRCVAPLQFIYDSALLNGRWEAVEWARDCARAQESILDEGWTCALAACCGDVRLLKWAQKNRRPWDLHTCAAAASSGRLNVLQWARKKRCPWDSFTCAAAASNGHLTILQWARANGCPWDERTCCAAAGNGHLTVLEYAIANGCPWNASTCSAAAGNGHLTMLEYAVANGCPWNSDTCSEAAREGHLIVLQWARANGCPWDEGTASAAARNGHLEVLKWALYNDCPLKSVARPDNLCERFLNRWIFSSRLIDWNVDVLSRLLRRVVAQNALAPSSSTGFQEVFVPKRGMTILDEVSASITLPDFDERRPLTPPETDVELSDQVLSELREFVCNISEMHRDNFFHTFEHASHVVMSVTKSLSRIVAPCPTEHEYSRNMHHPKPYGIAYDPLTKFACVFSALIHDVDHSGVPNAQLIKENPQLAASYQNKSVAEQNSLDVAWDLFMEDSYVNLRGALFSTLADLQVFRQLVVNCVMATDLFDSDLRALRNARWDKAFHYPGEADETITSDMNRKATIVIEHLMQAADVQHTMQHWHIYRKWNERLFFERKEAYLAGRSETDPANGWYQQELDFLDFYVIPLARKLKDCGVFGVSSDEYLNYAMQNRQEWAARGRDVVEEMIERSRDLPGTRAQKRWIQW